MSVLCKCGSKNGHILAYWDGAWKECGVRTG